MTTLTNGQDSVAPMGGDRTHPVDDSPAMGLLRTIRDQAAQDSGELEPTEIDDQLGIDAPSEPDADQQQEEPKAADQQKPATDDDIIEIPAEEEGGEPQRLKVSDVVAGYKEYQALEGRIGEIVTLAEQRTHERATQIYEHQDKALKTTIDTLQVWHTALNQMAPKPPPTSMLDPNSQNYDPDGYHRAKAGFDQVIGAFQAIDGQLKNAQAEQQRLLEEKHNTLLDTEMQRLFRLDPEWRSNFNGVAAEVREVMAKHYGFDEQTLFAIADHRFFRAARDLVKYHKLQASAKGAKAEVEKRAPAKVVRTEKTSQARATPGRDNSGRFVSEAAKNLSEGGYTQDKGVSYFQSLIRNNPKAWGM